MSRAAERLSPKSLLICGGVARNKRLRAEFEQQAQSLGLNSYVPSPKLCTDNAAMVGALALSRIESEGKALKKKGFSLDLDAYPRIIAEG